MQEWTQATACTTKVFEWTPGAAGCAQSKETQWAGLMRVTVFGEPVFGEPVPLVLPVTLGFVLHEHHSNKQMTALE